MQRIFGFKPGATAGIKNEPKKPYYSFLFEKIFFVTGSQSHIGAHHFIPSFTGSPA